VETNKGILTDWLITVQAKHHQQTAFVKRGAASHMHVARVCAVLLIPLTAALLIFSSGSPAAAMLLNPDQYASDPQALTAATITVQSAIDDGTTNAANCPGASCRLRDALAAANSGDTINFNADFTITLANTLIISKSVTIDGAGYDVTVSGNNAIRVFTVNAGVTFNLQNLTVANGYCDCDGGGLYNAGNVNVTDSTFSNNTTTYNNNGGGIASYGALTVTNSVFSGNSATTGGGIYIAMASTLNLYTTTLSGNTATRVGGGLYINGWADVSNSTIVTNTAIGPNGITGTIGISGTDGSAAGGGGIAVVTGILSIRNTTILSNSVTGGDGGKGGAGSNGSVGTAGAWGSSGTQGSSGGSGGTGSNGIAGGAGGRGGDALGGGLYIYNSGVVTFTDSTLIGNVTYGGRGGYGTSGGTGGNGGSGGRGGDSGCDLFVCYTGGYGGVGSGGGIGGRGGNGGVGGNALGGGVYNLGRIVILTGTLTANQTIGGNGSAGGNGKTGGGGGRGGDGGNGGSAIGCGNGGNGGWGGNGNTGGVGGAGGTGGNGQGGAIYSVNTLDLSLAKISNNINVQGGSGSTGATGGNGGNFGSGGYGGAGGWACSSGYSGGSGGSGSSGSAGASGSNGWAQGGGLYQFAGTTNINSNSIISGNQANGSGGGIVNASGVLTVANSTLSGNSAPYGGGIDNYLGLLILQSSILSGNSASPIGGGFYNSYGTLVLTNSILSNNSATSGGGFYNFSGTLTIQNSTFASNSATNGGGGYLEGGLISIGTSTFFSNTATNSGGGLYNLVASKLMTSTFDSNGASTAGGGIWTAGALTVTASTFTNNRTTTIGGGGITSDYSANLSVSDSTFTGNEGAAGGGAIYLNGPINLIANNTFASNHASIGGAIHSNSAVVTMTNNTFASNTAADRGAVDIRTGSGRVLFNTFYNNSASGVGDSIGVQNAQGGSLAVSNNIFSAPTTDNCNGTIDNGGGNLQYPIGSNCPAAITANPLLGALANDGGRTQTMALLPGSPAIDATSTNCPATDQRGVTRNATCDIGAYESRGFTLIKSDGDNQSTLINTAFTNPLSVTLIETGGSELAGVVITFTAPSSGASIASPTTVTATANANGLAAVSIAANGIGGSYTVIASASNVSPSLTFNLANTYIITPMAGANGSISPSTPQSVNYGDSITFTIAPDTGYHIIDVSVDGVSQGPIDSYTFTNVTANHTITATFAINTYVITPTAGSNGSITPSTPQTINYGDSITFTIAADTGYHISDVVVDGVSQGAIGSYTFTNVNADQTITAAFAINTYIVTPTAGSNGSITPSTPQIVNYGDSITFTIGANAGYHISDVRVDSVSQGAISAYAFNNVVANHTITAAYAINTYVITPTAGSNGSIMSSTLQTVNYGSWITFTIIADTGYHITDVGVDGVSQGAIGSYTFNNVVANHIITAVFAINTYVITPTAGSNGSITPSTPQIVNYGDSITFTIVPTAGYAIADVWIDGVSQGSIGSYTFSAVAANHNITASFANNLFIITPIAGTGGQLSPSNPQAVTTGNSITFTISANIGFAIQDVAVDGASQGAITSYTFNNVTANHIITAAFFSTGPQTQTIGLISVKADNFTDLGDGQTQADGNVRLGHYLFLTGPDDSVIYDAITLTATGKLTLIANDSSLDLLLGTFRAPITTGIAVPIGTAADLITSTVGFLMGDLSISSINIPIDQLRANANLSVQTNGISTTTGVDLYVTGTSSGIVYSGTLDAFDFTLGGLTVTVASGVTLSNNGILIPTATITMPASLGNTSGTIYDLSLTSSGLSIGGGDFNLPDIKYGDGSKLKIVAPVATLATVNDQYQFSANGTLSITLPNNSIDSSLAFTITQGGQLTGTLDNLNLTVAGATLTLTNVAITNSGLSVDSASLQMPASLGNTLATIGGLTIDQSGLSITDGSLILPDIKYGDGSKLKIVSPVVTLASVDDEYQFSANGTLSITLPNNSIDSSLAFTITQGGQLTGTLDNLNLTVAGATLTLTNIAITNSGLSVDSASLQMPASLGSALATIGGLTIDQSGLSITDGSLILPDIKYGDGSKLKIVSPVVTLASVDDQYQFSANGTLSITLPSNSINSSLAFTITQGGQLTGTLDTINLLLAGGTLTMTDVAVTNRGLSVGTASLKLPASLGGGLVTVNDVAIDQNGLSVSAGRFTVADIKIGDGNKVKIVAPTATLSNTASGYMFGVSGTLQLRLPDNSQDIAINGSVNTSGQFTATISSISLTLAKATLKLNNIVMNNTGLSVLTGTLVLPANLGSASGQIVDVRIDANGLSIGGGSANFPIPNFKIGGTSGFGVSNALASLTLSNNGGSTSYRMTLSGTIAITLPGTSASANGLISIDNAGNIGGSVSAFTLSVAGLNLSVSNVSINPDGSFSIGSATLALPGGFGGGSATVNNVKVTPGSPGQLSIGSGSLTLPDIKFGDGSKVKISHVAAQLTQSNNKYSFTFGGTLNLNLPGNSVNSTMSFSIRDDGQISGTVDLIKLTVAGGTLTMTNVGVTNSGLTVGAALLKMPASLGNAVATINGVSIDESGLHLGGGSLMLADINIGDGSKVKIARPMATLGTIPGGYTFGISGTLQLRLPSNSQNISMAGSINSTGQFTATVSALALTFGGATLNLNNIALSNTGLSVVSGTLNLPAKLGGASGSVNNIVINSNGLSVGGGAVTFPIPNFKIGGASGFSVSNAQAGLELTNGGLAYRLNLSGTVAIKIPSSSSSASGRVSVDDAGNISGRIDAFALSVAGLGLNVSNVSINPDGSLSAGSAGFTTPSGFGGASASVYNVVIRPGNPGSLSIGGGKFTLPAIKAGGFALALSGSLTPISGGYEISTTGFATFPGIGGAAGCQGIGVGATIWTNGLGQTQLTLRPAEPDGLVLKNASFNLQCQIPIGATGFFITSISGDVTLSSASTQVNVAIQIAAGKKLAGLAVLSADANATIKTNPFDFTLNGAVRVFVFKVGGASVHLTDHSFNATLYVDMIVANGNVTLNAWSDNGFHLGGSGNMEISLRKGSVWTSPSFPIYYLSCQGFWPSCQWKSYWVEGISIPPIDFKLASTSVEFGEFSGDRWGMKAKASLYDYNVGIYVDNQGNLSVGNVDSYKLVTPTLINQALAKYQAAQHSGLAQPDRMWEVDGIQFVDNAIIIPQTLTTTTDAIFALARNQSVPTLTLMTPTNSEIAPNNLPANVYYQEVLTYTPIVTSSGVTSATIELAYQWGKVRFTHARTDLGTVDMKVDGSVLFSNIGFGDESADRVLMSGTHTLQLVPTGNSGPILYSTVITIAGNSTQRLIGVGDAARSALLNPIGSHTSPLPDQAAVRFVNGLIDAPALDVALIDDGHIMFAATPPLSITDEVQLSAGQHSFAIYATGASTPIAQFTTTLVADAKYSLIALGSVTGTPMLQMVMQADELPLAQVRLVNALIGNEPINLLTHGISVFQNIPYSATTPYYAFSSNTLDAQLQHVSGTDALLYDLHSEADHTLIALGYVTQTQAVLLIDDNTLPHWGTTRVRFVNASPDSLPVDVKVQSGSMWFTNTAYMSTSHYLSLAIDSGTLLTLEVRDHATSNLLLTVPHLKFIDGYVYTLFLMGLDGGSPSLQLIQQADLVTLQNVQSQYTVHQAQAGSWGMKLNGNIVPTDQYLLTMLGSNPAPILANVTAGISGTNIITAGWQLTSDELATKISIYANPDPITTTAVITNDFNITSTVVNTLYVGLPLAQNLTSTNTSWIDGSLQQRTFDSNLLPSGIYHVWFEADDGRNTPVRVYAPKSVVVNHAATWPLNWTTVFSITPAFRELTINWQPHSHSDVDGYRLIVARQGVTTTTVITISNSTGTVVTSLDPNQPYSLTLEAYDTQTARVSRSQTAIGTPTGAPIALSGPMGAINTIAGQSRNITLIVTTTKQPYPGVVSWQVGCVRLSNSVCNSNITGLNALFADDFITPTLAGVTEQIVLSTTDTLPAGNYIIPIIATGSGVSRTLHITVAVQMPSFALNVTPNNPSLGIDQSIDVPIASVGYNGAHRSINLSIKNAPLGLLWSLNDNTIMPDGNTTLWITDTTLLASGIYPIGISGDDGLLTSTTTITLTVSKPRFNLTATPSALTVIAGKPITAVFALNMIALDGWATPITLTVDSSNAPLLGTLGLRSNATAGEVSNTFVVTPGGVAYLVAVTTADTPQLLYALSIDAQGGGRRQTLEVALAVREFKVYLPLAMRAAVLGQEFKIYLPLIMRSAVAAGIALHQ
jgi:hypothetical protein